MPRFSVIVPVYQVRAYLHECLDSVLSQTYQDLELIAVDDASPDAGGAILDEFAARDRRLTAVHLAENTGPGGARNAGLARATGDYVVFLDGGDTLVPGALQTVADRLKETGGPDVLAYDHARTSWSGGTVRDGRTGQLAGAGTGTDAGTGTGTGTESRALADRPGLLGAPTAVWTKAYKREFVERQGLVFPPGAHEDVAWTHRALLAAGSIAVLDAVCVHHRERRAGERRGAGLPAAHRAHFDVFDQYDRVFAFLDSRPALDGWRPELHHLMLDHFSALLAAHGDLPRACRAEFFRRARAHCRRYAPLARGASVPPRVRLHRALFRYADHRTYRAVRAAQRLRARVRAAVAGARGAGRAAALRLHYRVQLKLPLRGNEAVFAAYGHGGYACDPAAIEARLRELAPEMRTAWIAHPVHHHTVPDDVRRVAPGGFAHAAALARAKYLVNNTEFGGSPVKRPGQVLLRTHRGTPLKSTGLDLRDHPAAAGGTDFAALLADADTWDYSLSANRHSTLVRERAFPAGYTTLEYGSPRNDVFHRATPADIARIRSELGIHSTATAILYAPTHRDYRRTQRLPLDLERVARALGPRFVLLTRAHFAYEEPLTRAPHPRVVDVSGHPSVESLCLASDALVTDYSSLMFDYAALDRPIVVHSDDPEAYEAARGTYFDLRACPPGAVARTEDELIDIFSTEHWRGSRSAQLRAAFRARFCPYEDGRAAERVVRHVFLGGAPGEPRVIPPEDRAPVSLPQQGAPRVEESHR
ncbi:CDP-glycerol glycerophosphotransferase family protein [Streptomyces sp. NPDC050504]|uniref:bifunctional glycosyltransferase/CDP-glycerol:glycerophosphate glycerophosphotransferase n=1 Tax=Streptomyces sp. NPDC050504 TaxID=3365618 RepID=UPI0037BAF0B9